MKIEIGPITYDVVFHDKLLKDHLLVTKEEVSGLFIPAKGKIVVDPSFPPDYQQETLHHEVIHGVINYIGWDFGDEKEEEKFVLSYSSAYLDTIRRNPEFMPYILGK